eukprot:1532749-Pyramimonas_sp.AAC.1
MCANRFMPDTRPAARRVHRHSPHCEAVCENACVKGRRLSRSDPFWRDCRGDCRSFNVFLGILPLRI